MNMHTPYFGRTRPLACDSEDSHHKSWLYDRERLIQRAQQTLIGVSYDTVVVSGYSGMMAGIRMVDAFDKLLFVVRRPNDYTPHSGRYFGDIGKAWLFVDDTIDTGSTLRHVYSTIPDRYHSGFVGAFQYWNGTFTAAYALRADYSLSWPR